MIASHTKTAFESELKHFGTCYGSNRAPPPAPAPYSPEQKLYPKPCLEDMLSGSLCSLSFLVLQNVVLFETGSLQR